MERVKFSGVGNIIRFNWHYYALSIIVVISLLLSTVFLSPTLVYIFHLLAGGIILSILISLAASAYIYDFSNLYSFTWLDQKNLSGKHVVNIHAGFDETSHILARLFPASTLTVLDFYDPVKHTEVSIERARKAYPPFPGTIKITTESLPLDANSIDVIFLTLAAHEIRNSDERTRFLKSLAKTLAPGGIIIVTEHLRDATNFLAFTAGFLHFHSRQAWQKNFKEAGLHNTAESKITPFISAFTLIPYGTAS